MFTDLSPTYKGISFALVGYTAFAFADTLVKYLTAHYDIFQIVMLEAIFGIAALCAISPWIGGFRDTFKKEHLKIHGLRMVLNFLITVLFTYSLAHIPLTTVYALVFTKPFMATLLGIWLYKQHIEKHQALAIFAGFIGTLTVLQPGGAEFDWILLLPLGITLIISILFIVSNSLKDASIFSLGFFPMLGSLLFSAPIALSTFVIPDINHLWIFVLGGICATAGLTFISMAFREASAATVTPYTYTEIIWGIIFSLFVFGETPSMMVLIGAAIIIASGLYLIKKEHA